VILKRFSLLICPNDAVRYGVTYCSEFLSGIGRHFKRSVDTLMSLKEARAMSCNFRSSSYCDCAAHLETIFAVHLMKLTLNWMIVWRLWLTQLPYLDFVLFNSLKSNIIVKTRALKSYVEEKAHQNQWWDLFCQGYLRGYKQHVIKRLHNIHTARGIILALRTVLCFKPNISDSKRGITL